MFKYENVTWDNLEMCVNIRFGSCCAAAMNVILVPRFVY